jgi:endoglycosylceramidase
MKLTFALFSILVCTQAFALEPLRIDDNRFVDSQNRVTVLRGYNVSGGAKLPPFKHMGGDLSKLEALPALGTNVIRVLWIWEAAEPVRGTFNMEYFEWVQSLIEKADELGIYVILDFHQDLVSRHLGSGCGDGFPKWAVPEHVRGRPDNQNCGKYWFLNHFFDIGWWGRNVVIGSEAFINNEDGILDGYQGLMNLVASYYSKNKNLIGYELLNEPYGIDSDKLVKLYMNTAAMIHGVAPEKMIFFEPLAMGDSNFENIKIPNGVFSPHIYDALTQIFHYWDIDSTRSRVLREKGEMIDTSLRKNEPVVITEYGVHEITTNAKESSEAILDLADSRFVSAIQWVYSPEWTPELKDGWNDEDASIVDDQGKLRVNAVIRPYLQKAAGIPVTQECRSTPDGYVYDLAWDNVPEIGATEIFYPAHLLANTEILTSNEVTCTKSGYLVSCTSGNEGRARIRIGNFISTPSVKKQIP